MGQASSPSPKQIMVDGQLESNPRKMAEAFSVYHQQKIKGLRDMVPTSPAINPEDRLKNWLNTRSKNLPHFTFKPVTSQKVHQLLRRLRPGKAIPNDEKTHKEASPVIITALKHIINLSLCEGRFEEAWKPQVIAPHHKKVLT